MKSRLIFFIVLLFALQAIKAQDSIKKPYYNPEYITDYKEMLTARFYLLSEGINFVINPANTSTDIRYGPSHNLKVGLAVFHKWFGVGLAVKNPFYFSKDNTRPHQSSIIDLRVNAYGTALSAELAYQNYKGFYIDNPHDVFPNWKEGDEYPFRSDLRITSIGAIIYYLPNYRKHSSRAAYIQNERQLKSAGSPVVAPAFIHMRLSADSSLIPSAYMGNYPTDIDESIVKGNFTTAGISAGYSYTFVFFKYFYVNLSFLPGLYYQWYNYETDSSDFKGTNIAFLWGARGAIGYNTDRFYTGIGGMAGFNTSPSAVGNSNFNLDMNQIRFWIGTRFNFFNKGKKNK